MFDAATQRSEALALANRRRMQVSTFKRELRALPREQATESLADVMRRPTPHEFDHAHVYALLLCLHGIGNGKAGRVLREASISTPDRRLRDLTQRQRDLIALRVERWWA